MGSTPSVGTKPEQLGIAACLSRCGPYIATVRYLIFLCLACGLAPRLVAQPLLGGKPGSGARSPVGLELKLGQDRFLPRERMELEIMVRNQTGQPLTFRPEDDWLDVTVTTVLNVPGEGSLVTRLRPVVISESFTVNHTLGAKATVDIAPCFDLSRPGRYKVSAAMKYSGARPPLVSQPVIFEVVPGSVLWEQQFGWRGTDAGAQEEVRKYSLQQLTSTQHRLQFYVTVTDGDESILRQVSLGRANAADRPQSRLDRLSNLHVLHQTGPRWFTHTVIDPKGEVRIRATYEATDPTRARPGLKTDDDGLVNVSNAARVARPDDLMPSKLPPPPPAASVERRGP